MSVEYIRVEPYQDFRFVLKVAGGLISATAALIVTWRGHRTWEPPEDELSNSSRRVAVLLSSVPLLLLWTLYFHCSAMLRLSEILVGCAALLVVLFLFYRYLNHMLIFAIPGPAGTPGRRIIGGFSLTEEANEIAAFKDPSPGQLLTWFYNEPDKVWTHSSRGLAKNCVILAYLVLMVAGTAVLTCGAMMVCIAFLSSQQHVPLSIQPRSRSLKAMNYYQFDIAGRLCKPDLAYSLKPRIGRFDNGLYVAPDKIVSPQAIELRVVSEFDDRDLATAMVHLLPESSDATRDTEPVQTPEGNAGMVDIITLSDQYAWRFEDVDLLSNGQPAREVIKRLTEERLFEPYQDIVAVGTASHEFTTESDELNRAQTRASTVAEVICNSHRAEFEEQPGRTVYTLNLGRFRADSSRLVDRDASAKERRIIVFGVVRKTRVLDISWAVRSAVERKSSDEHAGFFTTLLQRYPRPWHLNVQCGR
ncbi:MAG TPA: hypothetical protein VHQ90_08905 [Thermoanaerobaculia bacterium]|nr:hypothetical protein [Thermoanaerobaculia bacterium]